MYTTNEVYAFLNYATNLPGKGIPKQVNVVFNKVPKELGHIDIKHLVEYCVKAGYLERLPTIMTDSATVNITTKGRSFLNRQGHIKT